ncbi:MAG: TIGR03118 family protein [Blastocatellia bacterium]|nr:TIGR03118 family protein [Blastocatellia bacterium]
MTRTANFLKTNRIVLTLFLLMSLVLPLVADNSHPNEYHVRNLVSDGSVKADHTDPNLINGWGVASSPTSVVWVAANGTGKATLFDGQGNPQTLVVTVPSAAGGETPGKPTGMVFNNLGDFAVQRVGVTPASSVFLFASEDGTISGWAPSVDPTNAILAVNNSASEAIYKGLAQATNGEGKFLYATDFHNNKIDVFDSNFKQVTLSGSFQDHGIPKGFAPFGIQNLNGNLYVTYAKQDEAAEDNVSGVGLGFVDIFDANGNLIRRVASGGALNAPWGMAIAPADFGVFSNRLLIGNFGDGLINAFDVATGEFLGQLDDDNGKPIMIDGLWGMIFGNGLHGQPTNVLFFAAGPNDESGGLYGRIENAK